MGRQGRYGLATKVTVSVGALILLISIGLGAASLMISSSAATAQAENALQQMTEQGAVEVEVRVMSRLQILEEIASRTEVMSMEPAIVSELLKPDVERLGYLDMALVTKEGKATYVVSGDTADLGDRTYVQRAFGGEANVSDVIISRVTNQAVLMYASPIIREGEVVGVLVGRRDGNALKDVTDRLGYGESGYAYVINHQGIVVAHKNRDFIMDQVNLTTKGDEDPAFASVGEMIVRALKTEHGVDSYHFSGNDMYAAYTPVPGTPWLLVTTADEAEVLKGVSDMRIALSVSIIAFLFFGMLFALVMGRSISRPISDLSREISRVADYDLTREVQPYGDRYLKRKDEVGVIGQAIRTMQENLKALVGSIHRDAESVASSSEELTATSEQSSRAAEEVAKAIQEIANGASVQAQETSAGARVMNEFGQIIMREKELVEVLNKSSVEVERLKNEGFEVLRKLEGITQDNNEAAVQVQKTIAETNQSAEKIEQASVMIKRIADQTNLLALNAAIEAARAGDAGRGFAVVADEIRKLAEQSNVFADEISSVIAELGSKTTAAVRTMQRASGVVELQMDSLANTHRQFSGIASAIDEVKRIVVTLDDSSTHMLARKDNILAIVESLSAISQENAAGAEEASASVEEQTAAMQEIAAASEVLARLAESVQASVLKFKV